MNASLAGASAVAAAASSPSIAPAAAGPVPGPWPLWQRLGFRYAFVFFGLYTFPSPLGNLFETVTDGFAWLGRTLDQAWLSDAPFRWPTDLAKWLEFEHGWQG